MPLPHYTKKYYNRIAQMIEDGEGEKVLMVCQIAHHEYHPEKPKSKAVLIVAAAVALIVIAIICVGTGVNL